MSEIKTKENTTEVRNYLQTFSPDSLIKSWRKFWWVCVVLALLFAAFAVYRSYSTYSPRYESSVTFTVQTQSSGSTVEAGFSSYSFTYNRSVASQLAATFPSIIRSNILQDVVCNDLNLTVFPCTLRAVSITGSNLFTITAAGEEPEMTYKVLQSVIKNYPAVSEYVIGNTKLAILSEPVLPTEPSNTVNYPRQAVKYAVIGIALGLAWVVFYSLRRNTICSADDIREKLNQQPLGALPEVVFKKHKKAIDRTVSITNTLVGSGYLEAFRSFRNTVLNKLGDKKVILVTGTAPGEGKTSVSANLALSLTKMHKKVILIDGDLRNPSVADFFKIPKENTENAISVTVTDTDTLSILRFPGERGSIWDVLKPDTMKKLFRHLRETADYIVIDTSPIGITTEPTVFAQYADAAIMVVRQDTIRASSVMDAVDTLRSTDVNVIGCVLNNASASYNVYGSKYGSHYGTYGSYGYGYGYRYGYGRRYGYGYGYGYGERTREKEELANKKAKEKEAAGKSGDHAD